MAPMDTARHSDRAALQGVALMVCVAILGAIDAVIVKAVSPGVHPFIIAMTRALFGLLFFLPYILARPQILSSNYRFMHVVRAGLKLASLIAFFAAYAAANLADATAIAFTAPLFVTVGAWIFLSESPRLFRIVAVACGFVGVILVLKQGSGMNISVGLLYALLGAVLTAAIQLILKPMSGRDRTQTLVAWNLIITVPLAMIPAALVWQMPTGTEWTLLALQGLVGALNMGLMTRALSLAEASLLVPIDFLRLPIVAGMGYVFFAEVVPVSTWIGGTVIFAATLMMASSARTRRVRIL